MLMVVEGNGVSVKDHSNTAENTSKSMDTDEDESKSKY